MQDQVFLKNSSTQYPLGYWYPIISSKEIRKGRLYRLDRMGKQYAVWRKQSGEVCALLDSCPHRGAALSRGRLVQDHVECGYHGIQFSGDGVCQAIPLNGSKTKLCSVLKASAISLRENHGLIWMWWGNTAPSAESPQTWFDFSPEGKPYVELSQVSDCNFYRLMESNLDFGHFYFVHKFMRTQHLGSYSSHFKAHTSGNHIRLTGSLGHEAKPENLVPVWSEVLFPNLAYYETPADLPEHRNPLVIFASPVNEKQSWFTLRIYLNSGKDRFWHKLYWRHFFLGILFKIIHRQDLRLIETQPSDLAEIHRDKLVCGADVGIAHYHRLVKKSLNPHAGEPSIELNENTVWN